LSKIARLPELDHSGSKIAGTEGKGTKRYKTRVMPKGFYSGRRHRL